MSEMAVITPTYRPDADLLPDLHRSVLEFTPPGTVHHLIVPPQDRALFRAYEGPRCQVWSSSDFLPARYVHVPRSNFHVNAARPWLPVRGWVMQQTIKIAMAGQLDADLVLLADSDVVLVRPVRAARFIVDGQVGLYRMEKGVTEDMERHVIWHRVARELFGLPAAPPPPLTDYICPLNVWEPAVVRAMQGRIAETTGRTWLDVFNSQLHISEFILYGVFVDEVVGPQRHRPAIDPSFAHMMWERAPLDRGAAVAFADRLGPDAVAMMISAKSRTPVQSRRAAIERCAQIVAAG